MTFISILLILFDQNTEFFAQKLADIKNINKYP